MSEDLAVYGLVDENNKPVSDWPTIRVYVLERDGFRCQICLIRPATDVDHIWPRRLGGDDHVDNLRAACGPCNKAKGDRVDRTTASTACKVKAVDALGNRIRELEHERANFEGELIIRSLMDGTLREEAGMYRLRLEMALSDLTRRVTRWDDAIRRIGSEPADTGATPESRRAAVRVRAMQDLLAQDKAALSGLVRS